MTHSHQHHDNPFFNRQRITDPAFFRGRERAVEALYSAIATRQCRSVVGERKLGKSSLLTHLSCLDSLRQHGFDPQNYAFIYVDLEGMANISYAEFWPELLDQLEVALPASQSQLLTLTQNLALESDVRFMQIRRLFRRIERAGVTLVLMLDEFESLASNAAFDPSFYGELRSLAGEMGVVYITASRRSLYDLTYQHADTLSSPFFNIFSEEGLELMPLPEAAVLLRDLSGMAGQRPFTPEQIECLIDLAGPHPFFLQVVGAYLYMARQENDIQNSVPEQVIARFNAEAEDHFRYLWRQLSVHEKSALLHLEMANSAALGTSAVNSQILNQLHAKSLIRQGTNGSWHPFSRAFTEFLERTDPTERPLPTTISNTDTGDLSGVTLGNYRVLNPIGRGGMAVVYKGYQATLDRYVAIKVMSHTIAEDKTFIERFQREASSVARLRHQNLVQMLDFGVYEDISYMVMEYIEGDTLKARLQVLRAENERMPLPEVVEIIYDVAAAMDYAHAHGIVHRDVKPANIMLRPEERLAALTGAVPFTAVLTDFGVARMLEGVQITGSGATIGTPDYMSPEQAQGQSAGPAADIYALGVVLYEMLTGQLPFTADSPVAVLLKHLQSRPPLLLDVAPELPPGVDMIMTRALAKEPQNRYPTAGQLAAELVEIVEIGS
ncbi:MAG: protein kinase [Anaerolineales bacterium]|nr:protein kinase [Anaerolineales bacterium]